MLNTQNLRKIILMLGDVSLLYLSLLTALYLGFWGGFKWEIFISHIVPFSVLYFFWLIIFFAFGLYDLNIIKGRLLLYQRFFAAAFSCGIFGIAFFYFFTAFGIAPKTNLALNILIFSVLFLCWRKAFYNLFSSRLINKIIIISDRQSSQALAREILKRPWLGYKLAGALTQGESSEIDLKHKIKKEKIDILVLPENLESNPDVLKKAYQCLPLGINFINYTQAYEDIAQKIPASLLTRTWFLENLGQKEKTFYSAMKRALDVFLAGIILAIASAFMPFIAIAIKLEDRGPVLYKHQRIGKNKKLFLLIKFR